MILPPGISAVAFGTIDDGDGRSDLESRAQISAALGISQAWATIDQVHSNRVVHVPRSGGYGEADGLFTTARGVPLVVATADCVPVAIVGDDAVAIVHAGWRGVASGIVTAAVTAMGDAARVAVVGPHIGPCCYEVGDEVIAATGGHATTTSWGTQSVDLGAAIQAQLTGIETVTIGGCTLEDERFASHRQDGTTKRQVSVAWLQLV